MSNIRQARLYAGAIFDLALENNQLSLWRETLDIISKVVKVEDVTNLINNLSVNWKQVHAVLATVIPKDNFNLACNLLKELSIKRTLLISESILSELDDLILNYENKLKVRLTTAVDITSEQKQRYQDYFKKQWGKDILLDTHVDSSLIAGFKAKVGTCVLDESWNGKLEKIKQEA